MSSVKADGSNVQKPNQDLFFERLLMTIQHDVTNVLPEHISFRRFARMTVMALYNNPSLRQCNASSIILAIGEAAQLGLVPDGRQACIVPYRKRGGALVATFQTMYQGELQLAYNTGVYQFVTAEAVCANDEFYYQRGFPDHKLVHIPTLNERGDVVGFWAGYRLVNGGYDFLYDSKQNLINHGQRYSKAFDKEDSPWKTNTDEMCQKTILLRALRLAPKSSDYKEPSVEVTDVTDLVPKAKELEAPFLESQEGMERQETPNTRGAQESADAPEPDPEVDPDNPELNKAFDEA